MDVFLYKQHVCTTWENSNCQTFLINGHFQFHTSTTSYYQHSIRSCFLWTSNSALTSCFSPFLSYYHPSPNFVQSLLFLFLPKPNLSHFSASQRGGGMQVAIGAISHKKTPSRVSWQTRVQHVTKESQASPKQTERDQNSPRSQHQLEPSMNLDTMKK